MKKIINKLKLDKKIKKNLKLNPLFSFILEVMTTVTGVADASNLLVSNDEFTLTSNISLTNAQNIIDEVYTEASNSNSSPKLEYIKRINIEDSDKGLYFLVSKLLDIASVYFLFTKPITEISGDSTHEIFLNGNGVMVTMLTETKAEIWNYIYYIWRADFSFSLKGGGSSTIYDCWAFIRLVSDSFMINVQDIKNPSRTKLTATEI